MDMNTLDGAAFHHSPWSFSGELGTKEDICFLSALWIHSGVHTSSQISPCCYNSLVHQRIEYLMVLCIEEGTDNFVAGYKRCSLRRSVTNPAVPQNALDALVKSMLNPMPAVMIQ